MKSTLAVIIILTVFLSCSKNKRQITSSTVYYVPTTISEEARKVLENFPYKPIHAVLPAADDFDEWQKYWEANEKEWRAFNDSIRLKYNPVIRDTVFGNVPVLDIRPKDWKDNHKVLIYLHGGAYVFFSAYTMLMGAIPIADITGLRIISVNYTNAPGMRFNQILDQVIAVVQAMLEQGYTMNDIGIYGDSAGGGLAAGAVLKMRDQGLGMPAVVVLISPWSDITETGDTYFTLKGKDPIVEYGNLLDEASMAYAPVEEHRNPYVSPVYGDYSKGFPPTLIQGGTKEIFLSNFVRQYQAIDQAGIPVKLDLYEGMWHVFQEINFDLPESAIAHKKFRNWIYQYLEINQ
jgi:acetyl esterase/lipase